MASTLKFVVLLSVAIGLLVTTTNVMADQDNPENPPTEKKDCEEGSELCVGNIFISGETEIEENEIADVSEKK
ncbi:Hypothetical predicted protein [Octopus vulgaris]|uniref:Uncharacterized protein n=1 Tax=Octopus vulgaris TaxID=6645 RepID=A0AA36EXR5_OCTVU|nr:Hypothetical predicted protein [Octopus vulgaris]